MIENQKIRPARVIGPLGEPLTLDTLPPPTTTRWVVRRKAEAAHRAGCTRPRTDGRTDGRTDSRTGRGARRPAEPPEVT